jgi:hypothetical protein
MGGEGSGRRKSGSAETSKINNGGRETMDNSARNSQSEGVKKNKNQVTYNGPPAYLMDLNRNDLFADPRNIVQDKDGTNRPIIGGLPFNTSAERLPVNENSAKTEPYVYAIPPTEKPSEFEARIAASKLGQHLPAQQDSIESDFPEKFGPPAKGVVDSRPSQNISSQEGDNKLRFAVKADFILDLRQSYILARRQGSSESDFPSQSDQSRQPGLKLIESQPSHIFPPSKDTNKFGFPLKVDTSGRFSNISVSSEPTQAFLFQQNNNETTLSQSHIPGQPDNDIIHLKPTQILTSGRSHNTGSSFPAKLDSGQPSHNFVDSQLSQASPSQRNNNNNAIQLESGKLRRPHDLVDSPLSQILISQQDTEESGFPARSELQKSQVIPSQWNSNDTTLPQSDNTLRARADAGDISGPLGENLLPLHKVSVTAPARESNFSQRDNDSILHQTNYTLSFGQDASNLTQYNKLPLHHSREKTLSVSSKEIPRHRRFRSFNMSDQEFGSDSPSHEEPDPKEWEKATRKEIRKAWMDENKDDAKKLKLYDEFELQAQQIPTASIFSNARAEEMDDMR